ncbi:DUF1853 family protein [Trinickia caryophylli]|uniref:DUF1853 domain-containing protein n=1 Tax=Trinickia caryophylli TaxID=28094 RepID=A0A1X7DJ14_TRICW|nr:DUF1853 family protein [Trinickia caryophylli]PMS12265.1 DUF1853 domain-containing protein [Trinickia caryophylli]TRX17065.1 DUF1853 family protein [Trinickia caryophylli]WQE12202.1 DUF1853 family protein [Trinickia caryophylli]SMF16443.1 hypothetical protein SAMN06295900_103298 [Trinickia caryophylli]GLU31663.1 hypothetical protein Busp01_15050 [Trinickia caryophylli]
MTSLEPAAKSAAVLDALLDSLRVDAVRDLAWLLMSPSLLREHGPLAALAHPGEAVGERAAVAAWLSSLDRDPRTLLRVLSAAPLTRLGRYAETLLGYYLEHGPAERLVAANVTLRRAGRTLGECDFLVQTANGRRLHWELGVKCYLHTGSERGVLADYVGPNLLDRFDIKLARLVEHQLPLSATEAFASLGHRGPWQAQMLVKGWLFYRWHDTASGLAAPRLPAAVEPGHSRGFWVPRHAWEAFARDAAKRWMALPRLAWLAPQQVTAGSEAADRGLVDAGALNDCAHSPRAPTMVAGFAWDEAAAAWRERTRGFIVPDDWPARAEAFALSDYHQRQK